MVMELTNLKTMRENLSEGKAFLVDRINNLPDSILPYILSFLPIKDVVATSILSKQWRYVWTSVDKLYLDYNDFIKSLVEQRLFVPFVYRVLTLHQGTIKNFSLSCYSPRCSESDVINWIYTAVSRGVETLDLRTLLRCRLPLTIFSCKTLVDLRIDFFDIKNMNIPDTPIFPCLKKLRVRCLEFDTKSFKHLISRCPVLEHVNLRCPMKEMIPIDIVSSTLKRIELISSHNSFNAKVHLDVPFIEYLRFWYALPPQISIEERLAFLVEADISFGERPFTNKISINQLHHSFVRFIQPLANVRVLRLKCHRLKFLASVEDAQFKILTKLEIVSSFFEWRLLECLMKSSINLQDITLKKTSRLEEHKLEWKELENVATCLSSSLRKISIDGYSDDELPMVKYVLGTAQILERMDIRCSSCYKDQSVWKYYMLLKMQKFHRVSERCEISLV